MGFEPTPPKRLVPKTSALDRSAIQPVPAPAAAGKTGDVFGKQNKKLAPAGNQTRVSSVAGTYTITVLPALAFTGTRTRILTLEGLNTTLVL